MPEVKIDFYKRPRPVYGAEGERRTTGDHLNALRQAISQHQQANPAYMPFEGGTPTLAGNQLIEQARHNAFQESLSSMQPASQPQMEAPNLNAVNYAFGVSLMTQADQAWNEFTHSLGLEPGQVPSNPEESLQWINKTMVPINAFIHGNIYSLGGSNKDAFAHSLNVENFLRSRAGLRPIDPNEDEYLRDMADSDYVSRWSETPLGGVKKKR